MAEVSFIPHGLSRIKQSFCTSRPRYKQRGREVNLICFRFTQSGEYQLTKLEYPLPKIQGHLLQRIHAGITSDIRGRVLRC